MAHSADVDFRTRLQNWLPKLVLAPSFAVTLLFVYGFILFTVYLSFTGSKMLPLYKFVGFENYTKLWALQNWHTALANIAIFATLYIVICTVIGLSLAIYGISMALVQGVLMRPLLRRFGERRTVVWGQVFDLVTFGLLASIASGALALVLTPVAALGVVVTPALQGIMSRRVADDAQGELQGVLTSLHALSVIVAPMVMTSVFAAFTRPGAAIHLPGAPFVLSMALIVLGLAIFSRTRAGPPG